MSGKWSRRITTTLVLLSFVLQLAAIFSPGWLIDVQANHDTYHSVFYKQKCFTLIKQTCELKWLRELHADARLIKEEAGMADLAIAELDYSYHQTVLKQVFVIVSAAATFVLVVSQLIQGCNPDRHYHRLITWAAVLGTIPTGLMISVIAQEVVFTAFMINIRSLDDDRANTYVGFPYSLAMYIGSLTILLLAIYVLTNKSAGKAKERPVPKRRPIYDDDSMDGGGPVKAEFVPITENSTKPPKEPLTYKPAKASENANVNGEKPKPTVSTVCYSEKL